MRAIKAAAITGCIVFVFEATKQYAYPETSIWTSHTISILFTALAAAAVTFVVLKKERREAFVAIKQDVTKRKRSEELLQNSENKYRVLFENSADANWLMDETGFLDCDSAALEMFGYSADAPMLHPADISPPTQPDGMSSRTAADRRIAAAFLNGKERFEWMHQRKNASVFPAEVCLTALTLSGRPGYHAGAELQVHSSLLNIVLHG